MHFVISLWSVSVSVFQVFWGVTGAIRSCLLSVRLCNSCECLLVLVGKVSILSFLCIQKKDKIMETIKSCLFIAIKYWVVSKVCFSTTLQQGISPALSSKLFAVDRSFFFVALICHVVQSCANVVLQVATWCTFFCFEDSVYHIKYWKIFTYFFFFIVGLVSCLEWLGISS